jgi:hypothetical protein
MSPQDKLALGMSLFVVFFMVAFLVFPARAYREYFDDVRRRKRGSLVKVLLAVLYALSLPYFYDELVGLDSKTLSLLLQCAIGACAYGLLIDVAWFVYKNYGPPAQ